MTRTVRLKLCNTATKSNVLDQISKAYTKHYDQAAISHHRNERSSSKIVQTYSKTYRSKLGGRLYTEASDAAFLNIKANHNKWVNRKNVTDCYPSVPRLKSNVINFSQCTGEIIIDERNSFPIWLYISNPFTKGKRLFLPTKPTKLFNKYQKEGWKLGTSFTLNKYKNNWYVNLYFKKEAPAIKSTGNQLGIDVGLSKLGTTSTGEILGGTVTVKHSRKIISKEYRRQRNHVGKVVNSLDFNSLQLIAMEDIQNIHKNKSNTPKNRKFFKVKSAKFNRRLSKSQLNYFISLVGRRCEQNGVQFSLVPAHYTSQRCSECGYTHKSNRHNEKLHCSHCRFQADADVNGARNILMLALGFWDNQNPCKEVTSKDNPWRFPYQEAVNTSNYWVG